MKNKDDLVGYSFGSAIDALKAGYKATRRGWNGKGMFIYLVEGSEIQRCELKGAAHRHYPHLCEGVKASGLVKIGSHIDMKAADGSIVVGWLASQTDILAEDWVVLK